LLLRATWPNVRVEYGPLTLMQGWIEIGQNVLEKDTLAPLEWFKNRDY